MTLFTQLGKKRKPKEPASSLKGGQNRLYDLEKVRCLVPQCVFPVDDRGDHGDGQNSGYNAEGNHAIYFPGTMSLAVKYPEIQGEHHQNKRIECDPPINWGIIHCCLHFEDWDFWQKPSPLGGHHL